MPRHRTPHCAVLIAVSLAAGLPAQAESVRTGSGFGVAPGVVVTNAHVVDGCRALRVVHGGQARDGRVLAIDRDQDLAAVRTDLPVPATLPLRATPALRLGESVVAFGFPLAGSLSQEGNLTTGNVSALAGLRDDARHLQITAPVQPGNSGGPLLDEGGNVIGVITAKLDAVAIAKRTGDIPQNVNFAVKGQELERFLQDARVTYETRVTDRQIAVADIAEAVKRAAVRLECSSSGEPPSTRAARPSQSLDPVAPPPAGAPAMVEPAPALADAERAAILARLRVASVRTPYPTTSPGLRALTIVNDSSESVYKVTVGWLETPSARCPTAASAYRGRKDVHVALAPGATGTTMSSFPANARLFCIVDAAFSPARSTRAAPGDGPPAENGPAPSEPRGNEPTGTGQPAAADESDRPAAPPEDNL
jgi:S1-C subfamily serine protease